MGQETVEEKAVELLGAECVANLANSNWKERQAALETILTHVKRMPSDEVPCQVLVRTVAKKPGFKDAHFQVLKQRLELVAALADTGFKFSTRSASYCLVEIADKLGDVKCSQQAKEALGKIADHCSLGYVAAQIVPAIFEAKNLKNQENVLLWLAQAIKEFGYQVIIVIYVISLISRKQMIHFAAVFIQGVDTKLLLTHVKSALQNSSVAVRLASIQLISTLYMYAGGAAFRSLFDQEKPALLEQLDAEIDKIKSQRPGPPTRGLYVPKQGGAGGAGGEDDAAAAAGDDDDPVAAQLKQEALLPRVDISEQLNDALVEQLNDKNWKERQAALEKLETLLRDNKFIEPNLNELPTHLNKRMCDTNKILATTALRISERLAVALGSQGRRHVGALAPGMIQALSDNKDTLRKAAVQALTSWFDHCGGVAPFLENELLAESMQAATNPNIKSELCGWLAQILPKCKPGKTMPLAELKAILPSVYAYVEDRNPEVRTRAQELIVPLMAHVGINDMLRVMQKAKPASAGVIQPLLEKAKAELAAKAPPPPAPTPAAAAPASMAARSATITKSATTSKSIAYSVS